MSRLKANVSNVVTHLTKLGLDMTKVQNGLATVTQEFGQLQSKVESLATQTFIASGYSSASASYSGSSGDSYGSGAGVCRARSILEIAVVWVVIGCAVLVL